MSSINEIAPQIKPSISQQAVEFETQQDSKGVPNLKQDLNYEPSVWQKQRTANS